MGPASHSRVFSTSAVSISMTSLSSCASAFEVHWEVFKSTLVAFLWVQDIVALQATSKRIRHDAETVDLVLQQQPVLRVLLRSPTIASRLVDVAADETKYYCPSALSIAAAWERHVLPKCYQWLEGSAISIQLEPFLLSIRDGSVEETLREGLNTAMDGLGNAYHDNVLVPSEFGLHWDSFSGGSCCFGASILTKRPTLSQPLVWLSHYDSSFDTDDSDWDSCSEEEDYDYDSAEFITREASSAGHTKRLCPTIYQPLQKLFDSLGFTSVRRFSLSHCQQRHRAPHSELILGLSPTSTIAAGVIIHKKAT